MTETRRCRPAPAGSYSRARGGTESVRQHLEDALGEDEPALLGLRLEDLEISSCLRMPVAPATVRSLAICVSCWMLLSLRSLMSSPRPRWPSSGAGLGGILSAGLSGGLLWLIAVGLELMKGLIERTAVCSAG